MSDLRRLQPKVMPSSSNVVRPPSQVVHPPQPVQQQLVPPMESPGLPTVPTGHIGGPAPAARLGAMQPNGCGHDASNCDDDIENEPPLLEELGINLEHIVLRIKGVVFFKQVDQEAMDDLDLSGPFAIFVALATFLLCAGKISFSYVYGFGFAGCIVIWMLISLMSQRGGIDLYRTVSILGYGMIPIDILAFVGIFLSLQSLAGTLIAGLCILWSTATSSRFFATAIAMHSQRWLVAYPALLFYICFTLITVF